MPFPKPYLILEIKDYLILQLVSKYQRETVREDKNLHYSFKNHPFS